MRGRAEKWEEGVTLLHYASCSADDDTRLDGQVPSRSEGLGVTHDTTSTPIRKLFIVDKASSTITFTKRLTSS